MYISVTKYRYRWISCLKFLSFKLNHFNINKVWLYANIEILKCEIWILQGNIMASYFSVLPKFSLCNWKKIFEWHNELKYEPIQNTWWKIWSDWIFLPHLFNLLGFPIVFCFFFQALKFSSVVGTFDKASCFNES